MECEYCKNIFKTKNSLNKHKSTAKYCLKLRGGIDHRKFQCKYCQKYFTTNQNMKIHVTNSCLEYLVYNRSLELNSEVENLRELLRTERLSYQERIELVERELQKREDMIKGLQDKLENVAIVSASRPTTSNTQINNYIQKLEVITDQHLLDQSQHLTIEHIKKGPAGYAEYAMAHPFRDRLICVDYSRRKVKFKESDGTLINDPEMNRLASKFFQSIKDRNTELIQEYGAMLSKDFAENVDKLGELADFKVGVTRGAAGEKTDFSHEVIKNVCSQSVV